MTNNTGTCTDPNETLVPLFALNGPDFNNICIASNITSETTVVSSFRSCCGSHTVTSIGDGCYTYCNITTGDPQSKWLSCFQNSPGVSSTTDFDCFNGTAANLTAIGFTSTPTQTATLGVTTSSAVATITSSDVTTTTSVDVDNSTPSAAAGSPSASNSTTKASKAGHVTGFSKGAFMFVGLILVGHFIA